MARYIDAEKIKITALTLKNDDEELFVSLEDVKKSIVLTPVEDVAKVVRCKDCAFYQDNNGGYPQQECRWGHGETPDPEDYCSYGERISEDHDIKIYNPKTQHINADLADRCNHGTR